MATGSGRTSVFAFVLSLAIPTRATVDVRPEPVTTAA